MMLRGPVIRYTKWSTREIASQSEITVVTNHRLHNQNEHEASSIKTMLTKNHLNENFSMEISYLYKANKSNQTINKCATLTNYTL